MILAIDPGSKGGLAVVRGPGDAEAWPMPATAPELAARLRSLAESTVRHADPLLAVIEDARPMPREGAMGAFAFGVGIGRLEGVLAAFRVPLERVAASVWQREIGGVAPARAGAAARASSAPGLVLAVRVGRRTRLYPLPVDGTPVAVDDRSEALVNGEGASVRPRGGGGAVRVVAGAPPVRLDVGEVSVRVADVAGAAARARAKREHKERLRVRAQELFPSLAVTLATADALLIGWWALRKERET